jgi:hypothetical protein
MAKERQTERTAMRFTPTEARMLDELSERTGLSKTDVVRQAIRREHAERFGAHSVAKRKPKPR